MKRHHFPGIAVIAVSLAVSGSLALAAQDRFTLKGPNGVAFLDVKGYETWQVVAVSQIDDGLRAIVANAAMINAYREGVPDNGKPFPEGSAIVKIEWSKEKTPFSPYPSQHPDALRSVAFMEKDAKRFPGTNGWGYAQFSYDEASDTFTPYGADASFAKTECHACHTIVKAKDYIFTSYPRR